ncbi:MAG: LysM peptidoglycan-binding domain-containing protein [Muribaculaceae bacterium]|nr:LysM peptidoglycan-binding domain-containing protein [Muribaculaceae bacterium]
MNIRRHLIALGLSALALSAAARPDKNSNVLDIKSSITDNAIVYPESFETDTQRLLESWYMKNYTATDDRYAKSSDVKTSDEVIVERLQALPTVIEMPFNQIVRSYIDRYTQKARGQVAASLGLGLYYMPIFEQALEAEGLPLELKYLPVIESGLDPNAVSKHGATGLWQFMLGAARGLGIEVNSLVDERRDPYVASQKAASFLKDLYSTYGDWSLAIAAYNCGPGAVNKAIRRAGGDAKSHDFWSIYYYLSPETRGYVPMFIATNYVMNYYPKHNISPVLPTKPLVTDTVHINQRVHFDQISRVLDIPVEELRILNPQFRADVIPGTPEHPYHLILPSQQVHAYIMSEDAILGYEADKYARRVTADPGREPSDGETVENDYDDMVAEEDVAEVQATAAKNREIAATNSTASKASSTSTSTSTPASPLAKGKTVTHKVAAGETLASIAEKYGVTVASIKTANGLRRNAVRAGQQLKITNGNAVAEAAPAQTTTAKQATAASTSKNSKTKAATPAQTKPTSHTLKNGESLSSLSKKYGVSVEEIKKANGMKNDNLRAGDNIKIPAKKGAKASSGKTGTTKKKGTAASGSSKKKGKKKRR